MTELRTGSLIIGRRLTVAPRTLLKLCIQMIVARVHAALGDLRHLGIAEIFDLEHFAATTCKACLGQIALQCIPHDIGSRAMLLIGRSLYLLGTTRRCCANGSRGSREIGTMTARLRAPTVQQPAR